MDFSTIKTALVLAPHPDDGEFGCGATLRRLSDAGVETWYAAFSPCIKSLPEGSEKDRLFKELGNSAELMGIAADHLRTFEFEVREFERDRQEILETMVRLRKEVKPDLVFMPNATDIHRITTQSMRKVCVLSSTPVCLDTNFPGTTWLSVTIAMSD